MRSLIKLSLMLFSFFIISACFDSGTSKEDRDNADACSAGDTAACDTLDNELQIATEACESGSFDSCGRALALAELIASIPEDLVIASATAVGSAGNSSEFANKQADASDFLDTIRTTSDVSACLEAIPAQPQIQSPLCYGPNVGYTNHPHDGSSGQLPSGDLGLWVETEPATGEACAAAKLNELVAKAAYNVDLAIGSMGMMMCAAALSGEDLPSNGATLDLSSELASLQSNTGNVSITTATTTHKTLTSSTGYETRIAGTINNENIDLKVLHDSANDKGIITIEKSEANDIRGVSLVYELSVNSIKYKMVSSRSQQSSNISYTSEGEVSLHSGDDIHVMLADINPTDGYGELAYAWKAGGNDSHYRALNVATESTGNGTGRAYYGFVPSPSAGVETVSLDLQDTDTNVGMICAWTGPGHTHTPVNKVQYQSISLSGGIWTAPVSQISYAPTPSCDMTTAASREFVPEFGDPNNPTPFANLSTDQQTIVTNGTVSGNVTNNLLLKTSINFTLPTAPTVPQ